MKVKVSHVHENVSDSTFRHSENVLLDYNARVSVSKLLVKIFNLLILVCGSINCKY